MANPKHQTIARSIVDLTNENKLAWKDLSTDDGFQVVLGSYIVQLKREYDPFDEEIEAIWINVLNKNGDIIDQISTKQLENLTYSEVPLVTLNNTYEMVRRKVSGVDDELDKLIQKLNEKDIPF